MYSRKDYLLFCNGRQLGGGRFYPRLRQAAAAQQFLRSASFSCAKGSSLAWCHSGKSDSCPHVCSYRTVPYIQNLGLAGARESVVQRHSDRIKRSSTTNIIASDRRQLALDSAEPRCSLVPMLTPA